MIRFVRGLALLVAFPIALATMPTVAHAAEWTMVDSDCHSDGVEGWTLYNWCWAKKKRLNDGSGSKDIYAFKMTSSGQSTNGKYLDKLWVEPEPRDTSPAQEWQGADPWAPDQTYQTSHDCVNWNITIGGGPVPAAFSVGGNVCETETFGPKLYRDDPGHHAAIWSDSNCVSSGVVRKVSALVLVRVNQGALPLWSSTKRGANAFTDRSSC